MQSDRVGSPAGHRFERSDESALGVFEPIALEPRQAVEEHPLARLECRARRKRRARPAPCLWFFLEALYVRRSGRRSRRIVGRDLLDQLVSRRQPGDAFLLHHGLARFHFPAAVFDGCVLAVRPPLVADPGQPVGVDGQAEALGLERGGARTESGRARSPRGSAGSWPP